MTDKLEIMLASSIPESLLEASATRWREWQSVGVDRPWIEQIQDTAQGIFVCSEYVARLCTRQPDLLRSLQGSNDLFSTYKDGQIATSLSGLLAEVGDEAGLSKHLRQFRQREMLRIIWRDLAGWADLSETMRDLSRLADTCVEHALQKLYQWQCVSFGKPYSEQGEAQQLVVISMGKLGADELNLSSDIDLIFAYPEEGETRKGARCISNSEFFQKLGQKLVNTLSKQTEDGFVFRVDMRLRPFGASGPLVCSFNAMENYYEALGREWERYALIKARVIAGDLQRGEELMRILKPFIYRRYVDYGAYESLREMKAMIRKEVASKGKEQNIKVGAGGIREIEFIGQVFQLIQGGRETRLQVRSILPVLSLLQELNILPDYVIKQLLEAYDFLRRTEHRIQAWRDEQKHTLPSDELDKVRLAYSMGFDDWRNFHNALLYHRTRVQEHFDQVFEAPQTEDSSGDSWHLTPLWLGEIEEQQAIARLVEMGFAEADAIWLKLNALQNGRAYQHLSARGKGRMDRLIPLLTGACLSATEASLALQRSLDVIESIMRRTVYLALLIENPMALSQLVKLCAASPWITRYISQHPLLLDELLAPATLYNPPDKTALRDELLQRMAAIPADDEEQAMDVMRQFKHSHFLRVAAADIAGALPLMEVSNHLSWIAEVILEQTLDRAWRYMVARHGRPVCTSDGKICDTGFAVIAYGKLGGLELGYGSDLDLVFLHSGESETLETTGEKPLPLGMFFARLGQRMMHILTAMTPTGVLFEVDMRLRPNGASGMLVSSLAAFEAYQMEKAWTWEHQALVRARVVVGDPVIAEGFAHIRQIVLSREHNLENLRVEVIEMRQKMSEALNKAKSGEFDLKHSPGGIVDIEFMVQYEVLAYAHEFPAILDWTDNIRLLERLNQAGVVSTEDADFLSEAYRTYRGRLHRLKLQERSAVVPDTEFVTQREGVQRIWSEWFKK